MRGPHVWRLAGLAGVLLAGGLALPAGASAATILPSAPIALLGLPSLHSIIEAIANGFFGALAGALVPSWLRHGSVATIQHLVALPDPASWRHVSELQGEMTYLGVMLAPVTLAVGATRYWLLGLTGSAHPASALVRCAASSGVLVAYRWIVEQTVAAVNTLTHGILGLPAVAGGLARIISVLFGGALLSGGGGVFGAFLVIVGVVFAAGLFATQVLLTLTLALLIVAGPPLISLAAIPELSHLARGWADTLLAVALVPLGWSVLFATAGALCLDATSFTGANGGLPSHVAAAFAGLITFVLAVRLPLMALAEIRSVFSRSSLRSPGSSHPGAASAMLGGERIRAAQARLRAGGLQALPSLGASVGRAAGAFGTPAGGPIGAARRRIATAAASSRPVNPSRSTPRHAQQAQNATSTGQGTRRSMRERLGEARRIMLAAPAEAAAAVNTSPGRARNVANANGGGQAGASAHAAGGSQARRTRPPASARDSGHARAGATAPASTPGSRSASTPDPRAWRSLRAGPSPASATPQPASATSAANATLTPGPALPAQAHPARKLTDSTRRESASSAAPSGAGRRAPGSPSPKSTAGGETSPAASRTTGARRRGSRRKPAPGSRP